MFEVLRAWGVRHVFCCPGTTEVALLDASIDQPTPEFVLTTHESIAVAMADGFARASDSPGVAYLHTHLGLANGLAHLYCAALARSPVAVLTGLKPTALAGRKGFTSIPQVGDLARPFCKSVRQAAQPALLSEDLHRTLEAATTPPTGPAFLAIPQDILESALPGHAIAPGPRVRSRPDPVAVDAAARVLAAASRPLLVAGDELVRHGATARLESLAERLGAPVFAPPRHDLQFAAFRTDHPHFCGRFDPDGVLVKEADVVFFAGMGAFQEFAPRLDPWVPSGTPVIHLSEDPGQVRRLSPGAVALAGDAVLGLDDLLGVLGGMGGGASDGEFLTRCRGARRPAVRDGGLDFAGPDRAGPDRAGPDRAGPAGAGADSGGQPGVAGVMGRLAAHVDGRTTVVSDCVTAQTALLDHLPRRDRHALYSTEGGSLGWGVGASLGVRLALPERRVVAVLGDGVFQFGLQGLATAVRYGLAVTMVVLNNGTYEAVRVGLRRYGKRAVETGIFPLTDIAGPDYAAIARGFGARGIQVSDLAGLDAALEESRTTDGPTVIEVLLRTPG